MKLVVNVKKFYIHVINRVVVVLLVKKIIIILSSTTYINSDDNKSIYLLILNGRLIHYIQNISKLLVQGMIVEN